MADNSNQQWDEKLFQGLQALADSNFPRQCASCGRRFETAQEFLAATVAIRQTHSGLKQSYDDDDRPIVEVYRNCPCGSTLMETFGDRRDSSEAGLQRRARFGELMDYLISQGVDREVARAELLKVVRGQHSELLKGLKPPPRA